LGDLLRSEERDLAAQHDPLDRDNPHLVRELVRCGSPPVAAPRTCDGGTDRLVSPIRGV
jgi:hypothetical protein